VQLNLISKLVLGTALVLLSIIALFACLSFNSLKDLLCREAISDADKISQTIIRSTLSQMLRDDRPLYYNTIQEIATQRGVKQIRLINKTGRVIYSSTPGEAGTLLNKRTDICTVCHGKELLFAASSKQRSRRFFEPDGEECLGIASAIYNEKSCSAASCHVHPADQQVLGVLDVVVSLGRMHSILDEYRNRSILLTLSLIVITTLALTLFTQRLVNRPVRALLEHTEMLSRGELDGEVPSFADDELGELARAFNEMTLHLKQARAELEEWGRNLEQMVEQRTREITQIQAQLIRSEKLASLGELVAGIAHEINNPLTGILVFASLMQKSPEISPAMREDLDTIIRETKRCGRIVKGLLEFSRCSPPKKDHCSLNLVADRALGLMEHQQLFREITVVREYDADLPEALLDPNQLEQVLVNLLLNAAQAMAGTGELKVASGVRQGSVYLRVTDSGCGIPETILGKIFDPFFSTKENKGTGLGLSVSYGIVQEHGGSIDVESEVGVGTTFIITIPLTPAAPEAAAG